MTTVSRPAGLIVVGVDGSEHSEQALRWAATMAAKLGAAIDAVTAWHIPVSFGWSPGNSYVPPEMHPQADAERMLNETIAAVFPANRPAKLRTVVKEGGAARVLLEHSAEATMLVLGSRGHGGFTGLLLGSVSSHCAEHASCPVLVVHGSQQPPP